MKNIEKNPLMAKAEKQLQVHSVRLMAIGTEIIRSTAKVGVLYLELCQYIRENQIAPKLVSHTLAEAGFHRVRISEINRVAMASDENFREFEARTIGFDKVLALERGTIVDIVAGEFEQDTTELRSQVEEHQKTLPVTARVGASGDEEESDERKLQRLVVAVLKHAEKMRLTGKKTSTLNGYTVLISVVKSKIKGFAAGAEKGVAAGKPATEVAA